MRTKPAQLSLTIICLLIGVMLVTQFRTQTKIQRSIATESAANQATIISNLYDSNLGLRKEIEDLERQLEQHSRSSDRTDLGAMTEELNRLLVFAGLSDVSGPGVEVRADAPLTREDVLDLINEIRNAGAEGIALNDRRIVVRSGLTSDSGFVYLDGEYVGVPYVFRAVGQPDTLKGALERTGGVLAIIENAYPNSLFTVSKKDRLVLPAYTQGYEWTYAKSVEK